MASQQKQRHQRQQGPGVIYLVCLLTLSLVPQVMWGNGKYVKRSGDMTEYCGQFADGQRHGNGRLKFVGLVLPMMSPFASRPMGPGHSESVLGAS